MVQKRFPADTTLQELTFLNNKKIDAELYSYFQSISMPENGLTVVYKSDMPAQAKICKLLRIGDARTLKSHLKYLIEAEYMIEEEDKYILPNKEDIYLLIPLETIQFIRDTLREPVVKTYIYLGQKWKQKPNYEFTFEEIGKHIGIKLAGNARGYTMIDNILTNLSNNGLITISDPYWVNNNIRKYKLTHWSATHRPRNGK